MRKKILWGLIISVLMLGVIGFTYSFFSTSITGEGKDNIVTAGTLRLVYKDGQEVSLSNAKPGDSITKTFTVSNTGTLDTTYDIIYKDLINEIEKDELEVSYTCVSYKNYVDSTNKGQVSGTCDNLSSQAVPYTLTVKDDKLSQDISIASTITHEYTITFTFKEINAEQNYNQGKKFSTYINIEEGVLEEHLTEDIQVVYSETDYSLTFYNAKNVITEGQEYNGKEVTKLYKVSPTVDLFGLVPWRDIKNNVTSVIINDKISPSSIGGWFHDFENASTLYLSKLDTSNVTDMDTMFYNTGTNVETFYLDLSGWDTSNVTDMSNMFQDVGGRSVTTFNIVGIEDWDTSNVTDMSSMFQDAYSGVETFNLDLSGWDTSNVTYMNSMFERTGSNAETFNLDLSGWDTSNVRNMRYMFFAAGKSANTWNIVGLNGWDTSNVTDMSNMFKDAGFNAETFNFDLSGWDTSNVTDMSWMFSQAGYNAATFYLNLSGWDTSNVTDMSGMFQDVGGSTTTFNIVGLEDWDTSNVTDMNSMFEYAGPYGLDFEIDLSKWEVPLVENHDDFNYGVEDKIILPDAWKN